MLAPKRTLVFLSYADTDQQWMSRLRRHLAPLERGGQITLWDRSQIPAGQSWREALSQAIASTQIAVLLLSADFLSSPIGMNDELPGLLARRSAGTMIFPVLLRPCLYQMHSELAGLQILPRDGRPISSTRDQEGALVEVVGELVKAIDESASSQVRSSGPASEGATRSSEPRTAPASATPTRASLRRVLAQVLPGDSDFNAFCLDWFQDIFNRMSSGMDRVAKINLLLQYATTQDILARLKKDFRREVARCEALLDYED